MNSACACVISCMHAKAVYAQGPCTFVNNPRKTVIWYLLRTCWGLDCFLLEEFGIPSFKSFHLKYIHEVIMVYKQSTSHSRVFLAHFHDSHCILGEGTCEPEAILCINIAWDLSSISSKHWQHTLLYLSCCIRDYTFDRKDGIERVNLIII